MSGFFDAEEATLVRLRTELLAGSPPPKITIGSVADLSGSTDLATLCPGVFLRPSDTTVTDVAGEDLDAAAETQKWSVVVVVKCMPNLQKLDGSCQALAGALLAQVKDALMGWSPFAAGAGSGAKFAYAGRPKPEFFVGYAEFPIDFELTALVQSAES